MAAVDGFVSFACVAPQSFPLPPPMVVFGCFGALGSRCFLFAKV